MPVAVTVLPFPALASENVELPAAQVTLLTSAGATPTSEQAVIAVVVES